jgi:molybdenum cofactor biosynthesis enzyme MoaA
LDKIIAYAVEKGHRTSIATNGLKIASKAYLNLLKDAGLKTVYLSMTGFDEDSVYEITDLAKCAKGKMKALNNVIDLNLRLSIGCIIVKGLNEHLIEKIFNYLKERNVKSGTSIEYRNIGQVGRYMTNDTYTFTELKNLVCEKLKIENIRTLEDNQYSYAIKHKGFRINLTNWNGVSDGFDEDTNSIRGRMTEQFDVVPFLQHIKDNEGGY